MLGLNISFLVTFVCLAINGYADLRKRTSYTLVYLAAYLALYLLSPSIIPIILAVVTFVFNRDNNIVGGGDLDAALLIAYTLGISNGLKCALISCIAAIIFWMIKKDSEIPFITMLFIGYTVVMCQMYFMQEVI